jgi:hypothetical protein
MKMSIVVFWVVTPCTLTGVGGDSNSLQDGGHQGKI